MIVRENTKTAKTASTYKWAQQVFRTQDKHKNCISIYQKLTCGH